MKTQNARQNLWPVVVSVAALSQLYACGQPKPICQAARQPFATRYTLVDPPEAGCGSAAEIEALEELKGEIFGLNTYFHEANGRSDYERPRLAIKPDLVGRYVHDNGLTDTLERDPYSLGDFEAGLPGDDDFCAVPELSVVEQNFTTQGGPYLRYEWDGVKVYVTAAHMGLQFSGNLTFTQNDCTATYTAWGVRIDSLAYGKYQTLIVPDNSVEKEGELSASESARCSTTANCEEKEWGLSPDFAVECLEDWFVDDADDDNDDPTGMCVLTKAPPSLKASE